MQSFNRLYGHDRVMIVSGLSFLPFGPSFLALRGGNLHEAFNRQPLHPGLSCLQIHIEIKFARRPNVGMSERVLNIFQIVTRLDSM